MKFYQLREEDKQYFSTLLYATGIILFWRGVWEVSYELPILNNVYFCLFVGLFIITMTGFIYREFDFFSRKLHKIGKVVHEVANLAKKGEHHTVVYFDELGKHHHTIHAKKIHKVEHEFIIFEEDGHEVFVPINRIKKIFRGKELVWQR